MPRKIANALKTVTTEPVGGARGNTIPEPRLSKFESKNFCFTHFDNHHNVPVIDPNFYSYLMMGREICPETGNTHWQCFIVFKEAEKWLNVVKFLTESLGKHPRVESCKGTVDHNTEYCSKEQDYYEIGCRPRTHQSTGVGRGKRTDLTAIFDRVAAGASVDSIATEMPIIYHQYGRTLNRLEDIALQNKSRTWTTTGIWYWGGTGTGKSHRAFEGYDPKTHYVLPDDKGWWDAYCGQETVIINDFRGWIPYHELLQLVDKWPCFVRRRGRPPLPFLSKVVIITSSLTPERIYHNRDGEDKIEQLLRRFTVTRLGEAEVCGPAELPIYDLDL